MIARAGWWYTDLDAAIWHLNDSHAGETLLMVRMLERPAHRSAAWVGELDQDGIDFLAEVTARLW